MGTGNLRRARRLVAGASFSLFALCLCPAADVLTVGPPGSGADFVTVQAAVDAAAADDVLLVRPGSYAGFEVRKPLRILGDGTGTISIASSVVRDIGVGGEFFLAGVSLQMSPFTSSEPLRASDCAGTVVLHDVHVFATDRVAGLRLERCARALVLDSRILRAGRYGATPGGAVSAEDTELWLASSEIAGNADCCFAARASHGVELVDSALFAWCSDIRGGNSDSKQASGQPADGGTGIRAVASHVELFGGPGARVAGGRGHDGFFSGESWPGGPGLDLLQGSVARLAAALPVSGGLDGSLTVEAPAIRTDATSMASLAPRAFPTLVAAAPDAALGGSVGVTLQGHPGSHQILLGSLRTGPTLAHPKVDGPGLILRAPFPLRIDETLPASGASTLVLNIPGTSALLGSTILLQSLEMLPLDPLQSGPGPDRPLTFGNPVLVTLTR